MKKVRFLFWPVLLLCLLLAGIACAEKTTLMVYMCGSNLETEYALASRDLQEMMNSGYDRTSTEILILAGGSRKWGNGLNSDATHVCRVSPSMTLVDTGLTNRNMNLGEAETLSWFLRCGAEKYPADRYALILWDHGGGPMTGVCWDELHSGDHLTVFELRDALKNSPFRDQPLEWIGFDACLMSSLEVACQIAPYANYMIASQEREPGTGWTYSFLKGMETDRTGGETGRRIIDAYLDNPDAGRADKTLSCIDLRRTRDLSEALEGFFTAQGGQVTRKNFPNLSRLRTESLSFGVNRAGESSSYDLVDLGGLLKLFQADGDLMGKLEEAVVYSRSNMPGATGLSVYHPLLNTRDYAAEWKQLYSQIGFSDAYGTYIQSFMGLLTGERLVYWSNLKTQAEGNEFTCQLTEEQAENFQHGMLTVMGRELEDGADEAWYQLYTTDQVTLDENHVLHGTYDGKALYLVDDAGLYELTSPIEYQVQGDEYYIPLYPYGEDGEIIDTILGIYTLNEETGDLELKEYQIYDWNLQNFTSRADIDFSRYRGICFERYSRNMRRNEYGEIMAHPYWERDYHVESRIYLAIQKLNFRFVTHDVHEGIYQVMFQVRDSQNNWAASEPVQASHTVSPLEISLEMKEDPRLELQPFGYRNESRNVRVNPLGLVITNRTEKTLNILMNGTHLNGVPTEVEIGVQVAPGEKGVAEFPVDLDWLPWLRPQRVLQEISGTFLCWEEGQEPPASGEPYSMRMEMSLASLYRSTTALPAEDADWSEAVTAAEGESWRVSLRGISSLEGRVVLTLEYENRGESPRYFCPDLFRGDGEAWNHGVIQFSGDNGFDGNGLRPLRGQSAYAPPLLEVPAGKTLTDYVQVTPGKDGSTNLRELAFRVHLYDLDDFNLITEEIRLSFPTGLAVSENTSAAVPAGQVSLPSPAGEELYGINNLSLEREVRSPEVSSADLITLRLPEGVKGAQEAYYRIVSLVSGEEELYDRYMHLTLEDRQRMLMSLTDTPLMIPVQTGMLKEENGVLQARCLPWMTTLRAGGEEEMILYVMSAWLAEDLIYQESMQPVTFFSTGSGYYADQVRELSLGIMPRAGRVFSSGALWMKYGAPDAAFDTMRINGPWPFLPEEAREKSTASDGWPAAEGYQTCALEGSALQLGIRKPTAKDHLVVLFDITDADGQKMTLPPVPLTDYMSMEEEGR